MAKWVCSVCGYVYEGDAAPEKCPQCGVSADKFNKQEEGELTWAAEHVVGVAQGVDEEILQGLRDKSDFTGRKQPTKKQSMLLSLQNFSAKLSQTAQRKTLRCV